MSLRDKLIKEIAEKMGIYEHVVHKVVQSQFEFAKDKMSEFSLKPIRWRYIGVVSLKEREMIKKVKLLFPKEFEKYVADFEIDEGHTTGRRNIELEVALRIIKEKKL